MTRPPKERRYYALIPHPSAAGVLLVETAGGWEPPGVTNTDANLFAGGPLAAWVQEHLGLSVTQLRAAEVHIDPADDRWDWALVALDNHSPDWSPPVEARWVDRAMLAGLPLAHPEQCATIDAWLAEMESGAVPALRSPWARPGWWASLTTWVDKALAERGRALRAPLEQRKVWGISSLLRGDTAQGAVYVKACATQPLFTNEATFTAGLAARYPAWVPTPLAVEGERRWMLLDDFGGELLETAPPAAWVATVDAFATLQIESVGQVDALLAAGCLDRRLDRVIAALPALLADVQAYHHALTDAELAAFAACLPELEAACAELAAGGVPQTLVHGDLHDNNIAIVDAQPLFFDWSDACIAHPFFDLTTLFFGEHFTAHPQERDALQDRYLGHWTAYAPLADLRRMATLATRLGSLHQVISYISIVRNLEPAARWENSGGIDEFVRQILGSA
ncbi:MAG TPA: aminoglycoside phosphotransferase family protein [Chloroflexia bacterium]|nr:aminoglycoside phosphotransferase family protein [Chloroflexia bacterium]